MSKNRHKQFLLDLRTELKAEGYDFVSLRDRELRVRYNNTIEIYAQRSMGEGTNNSFTLTWPPGFEFCGSESA